MEMDDKFLPIVVAIEGLTRAVLEVKFQLERLNEEGVVVVASPNSLEN